ncbi:katanin p60 ATPase-like protein-containing subunit A-like 2 [Phlyctochytrium arcticum]|nr:katanin p60 ATPase-like protein-containing subunit A-like 2 [Phlyctochytrium arcticum]
MMQSSESNLTRLKVSSEARQAEETRLQQRRRNLMVLILGHLEAHGYIDTIEKLQTEANVSLKNVRVADNMDLLTILQEYEGYYSIKFGRNPKLVSKVKGGGDEGSTGRPSVKQNRSYGSIDAGSATTPASARSKSSKVSKPVPVAAEPTTAGHHTAGPVLRKPSSKERKEEGGLVGGIVGMPVGNKPSPVVPEPIEPTTDPSAESLYDTRLLKPIPDYGNIEYRELAAIISRDIFVTNPNVRWSDIAGLATSKRLVKESVVYPLKFPSLFKGILSPWKGLLLYGPPGTGKTMIAKAVATECNTTFFNISASSIVSKWRGDSEKLVRVLFELARYHAPSTIFLDELESIMSQRTSDGGEHEGSRRMKTELLIQMDGLAKSDEHVFMLAASNMPWDLDMAMLRRLEKRILVDVPDTPARQAMFEAHLPANNASPDNVPVAQLDYAVLADMTAGYSGSDIKLVCKEAAMRPIRRLFDALDKITDVSPEASLPSLEVERQPVTQQDVLEAINSTRPAGNEALGEKYRQWQVDFGSA